MSDRFLRVLGLALLAGGALAAGAQSSWTVKPAWVQAHEEFLASDVLAGRGSATRDEQITATYVASEFMGYGLTTAPGMTGYLQSARIVSPALDGHASLSAAGVSIKEGSGLTLIIGSGESASGPLRKIAAADVGKATGLRGAVVLIEGSVPVQTAYSVTRGGAAAVLVEEDDTFRKLEARFGGHTRVSLRLEGEPADGNLAGLSAERFAAVKALPEASPVTLTVHALPEAAPRMTYNAIGYLPGSDANAGTILLTAHLDHLGIAKPVGGDAIYNGANDDAAGTTAVLELAHALAAGPKLRRSVLFVCYGSEEIGELGSTYFGEHPPVPLTSLVANLEFEMIGNQDPKMPKGVLLLTGWDRSNLGPELKAHGALLGPDPYPEQHFFERSDNYALALKGVVAHTAAGWGTPPTYHQPNDDLQHLDVAFMTAAIQSLVEPVRWLATSDFKPQWNAGGQPTGR